MSSWDERASKRRRTASLDSGGISASDRNDAWAAKDREETAARKKLVEELDAMRQSKLKAQDDAHKAILERMEKEHAAAMKRLEEEYAAVMKRKERMEKEHAATMKRKDEEHAALIKRKERLDKEHAAAMKRTDGEHSGAVKILERLKKKHAAAMKTKYNAVIPERLAATNDDQRLPQEMKVDGDMEIRKLVACMEEMFTGRFQNMVQAILSSSS